MVIRLLAVLTLFSDIALMSVFGLWIVRVYSSRAARLWSGLSGFAVKRGQWGALVVATAATVGSLYFSDVAGLTPCKLCWYQRIFMYPLPFILVWALYKRSREAATAAVPLAVAGALIALFHYSLQFAENPSTTCLSVGFSVSCSERFATHFGYITIPFMAFTAFVVVLVAEAFQHGNT